MMPEKKPEALLQVEGLKVHFPTKLKINGEQVLVKAVDDISFTVKEGETFGLVGESGCGKTTAGKAILRVINPSEGKVIYNGRDIAKVPAHEIKGIRRELQLIFQDPYSSLDPRQSVFSILKEAIVCDRKHHSASEIKERVDEPGRARSLYERPISARDERRPEAAPRHRPRTCL